MMVRRVVICLAVLAGLAYSAAAQAQHVEHFVHGVVRDFKRNNCWPEPFIHADRQRAQAPFAMMVHNGWRAQTTLSDYHFNPQTNELTRAGELKVRWILANAPPQYRAIYVHQALLAEHTATRLYQVQQVALAQVGTTGKVPPVMETRLEVPTRSANAVNTVAGMYDQSMPEPRLTSVGGE